MSQFGFSRGKSCEHCLSLVNIDAYKSFNSRQIMGALFHDIEGAYNNDKLNIIFQIINKFNILFGYKHFIRNFLEPKSINFYESGMLFDKSNTYKGLTSRIRNQPPII